jgi:heme-degrading monooxygenase HmoA
MIVDRTVLYAKWGRIDELKEIFKGMLEAPQPAGVMGGRILTDLSGRFFRLIVETEFEDLAAWENWRATEFSKPEFAEMFAKTADLVESGSQEFYTLEVKV